ncbi:hypothetical protein WP8S17C03_30580 [Metapseudomonas otitidis]|uniref:Uncharacterized protein n=1 Tax=Metapseudomonas otitidis TaxID=319939 RepID=A0A6S5RXN6_9GAMM|nr:hypothetical protein [Pseudomonas otitidis]MCO7557373.1 hypothetical protein [Pseudomonas otitidis]BBT17009.1 hypothetical protein WP8S17C03_30580 [Pseudomonas otitidis]
MSQVIPLILNGIELTMDDGPIRQSYAPADGGSTELRMAGGQLIKQTHFQKMVITTSATGYIDPPFEYLDYSRPMELWCIEPLSAWGRTNVFQLPPETARRPDVEPWAWAWVDGNWRDVPLSVQGRVATLTTVPGARQYRVFWLPRFTVYMNRPVSEFDEQRGTYDWSFEARER